MELYGQAFWLRIKLWDYDRLLVCLKGAFSIMFSYSQVYFLSNDEILRGKGGIIVLQSFHRIVVLNTKMLYKNLGSPIITMILKIKSCFNWRSLTR